MDMMTWADRKSPPFLRKVCCCSNCKNCRGDNDSPYCNKYSVGANFWIDNICDDYEERNED